MNARTRAIAPVRDSLLFALLLSSALAGTAAAQPLVFTRLAGSPGGPAYQDGAGSAARVAGPTGLAADGAGNVYVADGGNGVIRRISPSGAVTSYAGSGSPGAADGTGGLASFRAPYGLSIGPTGTLFVADAGNNRIRKVTAGGVVTTLAGSGTLGRKDGTGWAATFFYPLSTALDAAGNVYVADTYSHVIRQVTPAGQVTTFAGTGTAGYADGPAASAKFDLPTGMAFDAGGNLYVCDWGNNLIRKVTPAGAVSTFAGSGGYGSTNGPALSATFGYPQGLAFDGAGNLFVADSGVNLIRKITPGGTVSTFAGTGAQGAVDGPAAAATFSLPLAVAFDPAGNLYVADIWNDLVRKITPGGVVSTVLGAGGVGFADGGADVARFFYPWGIAVDSSSNVYVADAGNNRIRKVTPSGAVSTHAGSGTTGAANGPAPSAQFHSPTGVAFDPSGNLYVVDQSNHAVRKISSSGQVSLLAGGFWGFADGTGSAAKFAFPSAATTDAAGNVYVADTDNNRIRKITPAGAVSTLAGTGSTGNADGPGAVAAFYYPHGIVADASGDLYVADSNNNRIRKVTAAGVVSTVAGSGFPGSADGVGRSASFSYPLAIALESSGNLLVADADSYRIRRVTPAGVVTTVAGNDAGRVADGTGSFASFHDPFGIAVGPDGKVYVAEYRGSSIRVGQGALADTATVDLPAAQAGQPRHLDVASAEGSSWQWTPLRIPTGSSASLTATTGKSPLFTPDAADTYSFRLEAAFGVKRGISSVALSASAVGALCAPDAESLCLLGGRFRVTADYADYGGGHGKGKAVALTPDTGYFWFFGASNVEVVAKMVSFCGSASNNVAVYAGGLTDLDVTIHVADTKTGTTRDYRNPLGTGFTLVRDGPFGCSASAGATGADEEESAASRLAGPAAAATAGAGTEPSPAAAGVCTQDATTLCLLGYRYQVRASYLDYGGRTGDGQAVALTGDTGQFWFFDGRNVETVVKMVPFCGSGAGNVAVYAGGLTDVKVTLEVKDVVTGLTKTYTNPLGTPFQLIRDGPFSCP